MSARHQSFYDRNRQQLHRIVPLEVPFTVSIEPSSACDLRCGFCAMSSTNALEQRSHISKNMSEDTFALIVEQLKKFHGKLKRVYFTGLGEVLMHPRLPEMIRTIKENAIAPEVMVFTNGVKLTPATSLALVEAGLDIVTISVNGLNADDYERNCGRRIDFDKYVEQIAFLHANKGNLRMNLKTVDLCINGDDERLFFFNTFGDICDYIDIETVSPYMQGVEYKEGCNIKDMDRVSKFGEMVAVKKVCSLPFYKLFVSSTGKVNFCDAINGFLIDGLDIFNIELADIWNGDTHTQFLLNQLQQINDGPTKMCENCIQRSNCAFPQDDLDPYTSELIERIQHKKGMAPTR